MIIHANWQTDIFSLTYVYYVFEVMMMHVMDYDEQFLFYFSFYFLKFINTSNITTEKKQR